MHLWGSHRAKPLVPLGKHLLVKQTCSTALWVVAWVCDQNDNKFVCSWQVLACFGTGSELELLLDVSQKQNKHLSLHAYYASWRTKSCMYMHWLILVRYWHDTRMVRHWYRSWKYATNVLTTSIRELRFSLDMKLSFPIPHSTFLTKRHKSDLHLRLATHGVCNDEWWRCWISLRIWSVMTSQLHCSDRQCKSNWEFRTSNHCHEMPSKRWPGCRALTFQPLTIWRLYNVFSPSMRFGFWWHVMHLSSCHCHLLCGLDKKPEDLSLIDRLPQHVKVESLPEVLTPKSRKLMNRRSLTCTCLVDSRRLVLNWRTMRPLIRRSVR